MKKLYLSLLAVFALSNVCFAQDATYSNLTINNLTKFDGAAGIFGWGNAPNNTLDPRANFRSDAVPFMINNHTGLTFSAHSLYGGIRFYNQGYPNPYDSATGAVMVMSIVNGNVGIGTISPTYKLDVTGSGRFTTGAYVADGQPFGVISSSGAVWANTTLIYKGYNGAYGDYAEILVPSGIANTANIRLLQSGNVGIGVSNPQNKLDVNGTVHSKQVNVDMTGWSDYVFDNNYTLPSLSEVKTYIDQNHHLPEIPSEKEIAEKGLNLGEMNRLLTKKVEELTLYLIELKAEKDKQEKAAEERLDKQEERIEKLEKLLKH